MNKEKPPVLDTSYASRDDIVRDIDQLLQAQRDADVAYYEPIIQQAKAETDAISYREGLLNGEKKVAREIFEEIKPHLEKIDKLTSDIEGDWTDPRYECDKISEEIQAILRILEEK